MPRVSVIIPTRNRVALLRRAIRSVISQTYRDFEIIVVDDASSDGTTEAVLQLADTRIRAYRHPINRGEAASANTGLVNAGGAYIAFLHDDDAWLPKKLELQVDRLDRCPAETAVVYSGFLSVDATTGRVLGTVRPEKRGDLLAELRSRNWVGTPSTVLLRRECFEKVGLFDEEIVVGADYDMWIRIARHYRFDAIDEPLVFYSVHQSQLSADRTRLARGKEAQLRKHAEFFAQDKKCHSRFFLNLGVLHCYNRDARKAREAFLRAIRIAPLDLRAYFNLLLSFFGAENFTRIKTLRDRLATLF